MTTSGILCPPCATRFATRSTAKSAEFKDKKNRKAIGMIKFLLISAHFKNITFYPLGGIHSPYKLKNYGVNGFAGIEYFNKI